DEVCVTNINRQLHALSDTVGRPKVDVMAGRIRAIHPGCAVEAVTDFFTAETADAILAPPLDAVADAIDDARLKALLIARCRSAGLPVVVSGGAGGRRDPLRLRAADLAFSSHDPLLAEVRRRLRRDHGFPPPGQPFGVDCVFSEEPPVFPASDGETCARPEPGSEVRLDCRTGLGTAAFVTGAFGLAVAARVIHRLVETPGTT
ncbi:MAG: tRNA threonylcarbamoyladenosine dehydratase, partial [Verrucomicrobia bacterium]